MRYHGACARKRLRPAALDPSAIGCASPLSVRSSWPQDEAQQHGHKALILWFAQADAEAL